MVKDWFPSKRTDQLYLAENWIEVLETKRAVWGVPQVELDELKTLTIQGATVLSKAKSSNRSSVITAECNTAFTKLREKIQYIEQRWFNATGDRTEEKVL